MIFIFYYLIFYTCIIKHSEIFKMFKTALSFFMLLCVSSIYANEVKLEWQSYTTPPSSKDQFSYYTLLKGNYDFDFVKEPFYFDSSFQFEYSLDRSKFFYYNIPELYFDYKYKLNSPVYFVQSIQVSLGRKAESWSIGDDYWNLGLWNPLNRWNPLHPSRNGLIGSFFTFNAKKWESLFFIGAFYLPEKNVQIIEENGRLYSRSRWFSMLSSQVNPFDIDIFYSIDKPFIFNILFQQSFLFSFKTWSEAKEADYWMKWSFADKPVNHLFYILNINNSVQVDKKANGGVYVKPKLTVYPIRQRILSAEWGLDYKKFSAVLSLESTRMNSESVLPQEWSFISDQTDFTYFSALLKYNYLKDSFFQLSFIQSWFLRGAGLQQISSVMQRGRVLDGAGFDWQTRLFPHTKQPLLLNLKYQYSFLNKGAWLFAKAVYNIGPKVYTEASINILGALEEGKESFLQAFRHNDYYTWSIAYVF